MLWFSVQFTFSYFPKWIWLFIFKLSLPVFLFAIVQKHLSRVRFKSVEQILQHKGCRVRDCLIVQFVFAFFFIKLGVSFVFVLCFCFVFLFFGGFFGGRGGNSSWLKSGLVTYNNLSVLCIQFSITPLLFLCSETSPSAGEERCCAVLTRPVTWKD